MVNNDSPFAYMLEEALYDEERIFKFTRAVLTANDDLVVTLLVSAEDYDKKLTDELRAKVESTIRDIVPTAYTTHVVYKKTETDERFILERIFQYFYDRHPMMSAKMKNAPIEIKIEYGFVGITIGLSPDLFSYVMSGSVDVALGEYLEEQIIEHVDVQFYRAEATFDKPRKVRRIGNIRPSIRLADITIKVPLIGAIAKKPTYIADVANKESESTTVCGKVVSVEECTSKAGKVFFKFTIDDTTDKMDCLFFSRFDSQLERIRTYVLEDVCVALEGNIKMDERSAKCVMFVRKISVCDIDYNSIDTGVHYNDLPEDYYVIEPKPYSEREQGNMFEEDNHEIPELLRGKIVVFDLETTGLSSTCEIVEIGGVCMEDGVCKSVFATLVNPQIPIPSEASKVNGIRNEDVANAPTISEVIGDFYKFCYGATLVAHNSTFDIGVLTRQGEKFLYKFDNPVIDTLAMAKRIFKRDRGNSLESLCEQFGIVNEHEHRADSDAIATAKLFKILASLDGGDR